MVLLRCRYWLPLLLCLWQSLLPLGQAIVLSNARWSQAYHSIVDLRGGTGGDGKLVDWDALPSLRTLNFTEVLGDWRSKRDPVAVYQFMRNCLKGREGECGPSSSLPEMPLPYEEMYAHYLSILNSTAPLRGLRLHSYANFDGPWIENVFIRYFLSLPYSYWYPLVPLFVQMTDAAVVGGVYMDQLQEVLSSANMRQDVIYVLLTQNDNGPLQIIGDCTVFRNTVVLSAGGWGNVAIPLLKGELPLAPTEPTRAHILSFVGRVAYKSYHMQQGFPSDLQEFRKALLLELHGLGLDPKAAAKVLLSGSSDGAEGKARRSLFSNMRKVTGVHRFRNNDSWRRVVQHSSITVAMRGFGPTSYRLYEALQMGRVPLYVFSGSTWLPYGKSKRTLWGSEGAALLIDRDNLGQAFLQYLCPLLGGRTVDDAGEGRLEGGASLAVAPGAGASGDEMHLDERSARVYTRNMARPSCSLPSGPLSPAAIAVLDDAVTLEPEQFADTLAHFTQSNALLVQIHKEAHPLALLAAEREAAATAEASLAAGKEGDVPHFLSSATVAAAPGGSAAAEPCSSSDACRSSSFPGESLPSRDPSAAAAAGGLAGQEQERGFAGGEGGGGGGGGGGQPAEPVSETSLAKSLALRKLLRMLEEGEERALEEGEGEEEEEEEEDDGFPSSSSSSSILSDPSVLPLVYSHQQQQQHPLERQELGFFVQPNSPLAAMEARLPELRELYFTYGALVKHIHEFLFEPWNSELECHAKPSFVKRQQ